MFAAARGRRYSNGLPKGDSRNDVVWASFEEGDDVGDGSLVEELDALRSLVSEVGREDDLIAG